MNVEHVLKRKLRASAGCFATALDGCFGSQDAALLELYETRESPASLTIPTRK